MQPGTASPTAELQIMLPSRSVEGILAKALGQDTTQLAAAEKRDAGTLKISSTLPRAKRVFETSPSPPLEERAGERRPFPHARSLHFLTIFRHTLSSTPPRGECKSAHRDPRLCESWAHSCRSGPWIQSPGAIASGAVSIVLFGRGRTRGPAVSKVAPFFRVAARAVAGRTVNDGVPPRHYRGVACRNLSCRAGPVRWLDP